MRVPRFKGRRDVHVASAGFFTVLTTGPRTVGLRQPGEHRVLAKPSSAVENSIPSSEQLAERLRTTKIPLIGDAGMIDRGVVRMAAIVLAAVSFTYFILWWIMRGHL
jgi:hypothetical protein